MSSSDDGSIVKYVWKSDLNDELYNGTQSTFKTSGLFLGTHTITLLVQDDDEAWSNPDTASVKIHKKPTATIMSIDPMTASEGEEVTFEGTGSDDDGSIARYVWKSDIDSEFYNGTETTVKKSDLSVGTHSITLLVQDNDGAWGSPDTTIDSLEINPNDPPTATIEDIDPSPAKEGQSIQFDGSSTDSDGNVVAWNWSSDLDSDFGSSEDVDYAGLRVGIHTISFKVQDNNGAWSDAVTQTLTINRIPNTPPAINLTAPSRGTTITSVKPTLQWTADDADDGDSLTFDVYLDDNQNPVTLADDNSAQRSFTTGSLIEGMTYYWKVVAGDGTDQTTSEIWSFYINKKPLASINADSTSIKEGEKVSFNASGSTDEDGDVTEYNYTFGDGSSTGWIPTSTIEHVYTSKGEYNVTLKVRDNNGAESTNAVKWSIQVTPPASPDDTDDDSNDVMGFSPAVVIGFVILIVIIGILCVSHVMTRNLIQLKKKGDGKNGNS